LARHYWRAPATYPEVVTYRAGASATGNLSPRLPLRAGDPSLFGLAPCGVCHALIITEQAVRSYRTFSPLPGRSRAVYSLWHFPSIALNGNRPDVIRHTTLRSSDFPPPVHAAWLLPA